MKPTHPSRQEPPLPVPQSPRQMTQDLLLSVSALVTLWARKAAHALSRKDRCEWDAPGKSPGSARSRPRGHGKRLLSNISGKAMGLLAYGRRRKEGARDGEEEEEDYEFDFGDGGVWQRTIIMGDRCQPLDFSGVIYYDESGKQLNHAPLKSPRASPLPGYLARRADGEVGA
ncbi:hypothetical protein MLD38_030101 [Melastoma candidum]|uniref:Uncharacterized protein n=1 Tax=Melastoma candidum TaxID=119954 RepID=A0ACB9MP78_9MYRT|nr:hypothetical protein MLD38_030101 [Melastoma candidum]